MREKDIINFADYLVGLRPYISEEEFDKTKTHFENVLNLYNNFDAEKWEAYIAVKSKAYKVEEV